MFRGKDDSQFGRAEFGVSQWDGGQKVGCAEFRNGCVGNGGSRMNATMGPVAYVFPHL